MYHDLPRGASFWSFLFAIDQDIAETTRKNACLCGGRLHRANYLRKPRGTPAQIPEPYRVRLSFCCDRDGCRKRVTPPSVRFLGPKVYLGAVIIIICALRQGPTPRRVRELSKRFAAHRRTIARWLVLWQDHVPKTPFWKVARARLAPVVNIVSLPYALVDAFLRRRVPCTGPPVGEGDDDVHMDASRRRPASYSAWARLLRFLAPITIKGGLRIEVSR
jgi:hypothetical protein